MITFLFCFFSHYFFIFVIQHSKVRGAYCLGVFQNGKDPTTLLGGTFITIMCFNVNCLMSICMYTHTHTHTLTYCYYHWQSSLISPLLLFLWFHDILCHVTGIVVRNTLVTYDREHEKIGFWKTNCSELWERLHISTSPPSLPTSSNTTNTTTDMAPSEPPQYDNPGTASFCFSLILRLLWIYSVHGAFLRMVGRLTIVYNIFSFI